MKFDSYQPRKVYYKTFVLHCGMCVGSTSFGAWPMPLVGWLVSLSQLGLYWALRICWYWVRVQYQRIKNKKYFYFYSCNLLILYGCDMITIIVVWPGSNTDRKCEYHITFSEKSINKKINWGINYKFYKT